MDKMDFSFIKIPLILDGKFFKIIGDGIDVDASETIGNPIIIRANCQMCANKNKNTIISGYLRATSNFTTHLKV